MERALSGAPFLLFDVNQAGATPLRLLEPEFSWFALRDAACGDSLRVMGRSRWSLLTMRSLRETGVVVRSPHGEQREARPWNHEGVLTGATPRA
jgi:hypothetical protein